MGLGSDLFLLLLALICFMSSSTHLVDHHHLDHPQYGLRWARRLVHRQTADSGRHWLGAFGGIACISTCIGVGGSAGTARLSLALPLRMGTFGRAFSSEGNGHQNPSKSSRVAFSLLVATVLFDKWFKVAHSNMQQCKWKFPRDLSALQQDTRFSVHWGCLTKSISVDSIRIAEIVQGTYRIGCKRSLCLTDTSH